jgi:hypothetical protein
MSLFGKKAEPPSLPPPQAAEEPQSASSRTYGVADLIRLLKSIPVDQHPDLVVRVVKTTLESVGVHSSLVIEDAVRQESAINEQIVILEGEIEDLSAEIQMRRDHIAKLQMDLAETTYAKERLLGVEGVAFAPAPPDPGFHSPPKNRSLPPPLPPPRHSNKPPEPVTG